MNVRINSIVLAVVVVCAASCLCGAVKRPTVKQPYQIKNEKLAELRTGAAAAVATNDFDRDVKSLKALLK